MQNAKVRALITGSRFSWETRELVKMKIINQFLIGIYGFTEMELDDFGADDLRKVIGKISKKVEELISLSNEEIDRLIKRDSEPKKVCEDHESDKIYKCDKCMDEMFNKMWKETRFEVA